MAKWTAADFEDNSSSKSKISGNTKSKWTASDFENKPKQKELSKQNPVADFRKFDEKSNSAPLSTAEFKKLEPKPIDNKVLEYESLPWYKKLVEIKPPEAVKYENEQRANSKIGSFGMGLANEGSLGLIKKLSNASNSMGVYSPDVGKYKESNPKAYTAGGLVGSIGPWMGAEGLTKAAFEPVLKKVGSELGKRAIIGGTAGAFTGGIQSLNAGESKKDVLTNTALGAGLGIGGELLSAGVGVAFNKLRSALRAPVKDLAQSTEKIALEPVKTVKPKTLQGKLSAKNSAYDNAVNEYNDAITQIQNHFGTNELRASEVPLIKSELGIDLDGIISRMERAEKGVNLPGSKTMSLKRTAGAASDKSYELSNTLSKQQNALKSDLTANNTGNINARNVFEKQPIQANKSVDDGIGLNGAKERSFAQNVIGSKDTPEAISNKLAAEKLTYNPISEKSTLDKASKRILENAGKAYSDVLIGAGKGISRDDVATGELLIKKAFETGDNDKAYTLISHLAEKLTESGQAIQAAAMFKRMTPEGMLMYAEKSVNKANRELGKGIKEGGFADPLKKFYKKGNLTDDMKNSIKTNMEDAMKLPDGREKDIKLAQIMQTISDAMPKAPLAKLESFRTIAMLSNPKTWIRNYVSNMAFGGLEAGVTKPLSALTDRVLSLRTGQRSLLNTQFKELGKGFAEGTKNAIDDVRRNIDTSPTRGALELPRSNEFKNVPVLREIEKAVKLGVSGGDRPFYEAAYKDALAEQLKLYEKNSGKKLLLPTEEMKSAADEIAKYRTYADSNMLSNGLTKVKSGLNKIKVGGIGAGDVLMKFTRTPANLIKRGIDYSPAGLVQGMVDISRVLSGNKNVQRQAAESFSRGVIGTGFVTAAILLTNLGIIRGERQKSNTANAFEQAVGKGQYTFNVSALKRFISSGMDPKAAEEQQGDTISTYDWAQPLALSASVGANIGEDLKRKQKVDTLNLIGTIAESMSSGANTVIEQPMLQNVNRVFKGDNPVQGLMAVVQDYPASFVPAFLSGMRYAADPYIRDTSGSVLESTGKRVLNKLPIASKTLDKTVDILGNDRTVTAQTPLGRLADSAFNPTRITKVNYTPVTKEIDRLYKSTADGNILPNLVEKSQTIASPNKGEPAKDLTPQQRTQYQKILADNYLKLANDIMNQPGWVLLKDDVRVDKFGSARKKADNIAKKEMQKNIFGK